MTTSRIPAAVKPADCQTANPVEVLAAVRHIVEQSIMQAPRSLQRMVGPSQLGNPCDHCLACQLAAVPYTAPEGATWLPFIGTAVHQALADVVDGLGKSTTARTGRPYRIRVEERVTVGDVDGQPVTGSTDLFDTVSGTVFDWKIVGENKLRSVKANGPGEQYRAQAHLYGQGWVNAGFEVEAVAVVFLPRNAATGFDGGVLWMEPFEPAVAVAALDRATRLARNLRAVKHHPEVFTKWLASLPRAQGCFDCHRYPNPPTDVWVPRVAAPEVTTIKPIKEKE